MLAKLLNRLFPVVKSLKYKCIVSLLGHQSVLLTAVLAVFLSVFSMQ